MKDSRVFRSFKCRVGVSAAEISILATFAVSGSDASADQATNRQVKPTIVLVHGAFADSSSWAGVVERLQRKGYPVIAPANPCGAWLRTRRIWRAS